MLLVHSHFQGLKVVILMGFCCANTVTPMWFHKMSILWGGGGGESQNPKFLKESMKSMKREFPEGGAFPGGIKKKKNLPWEGY